MKLRIALFIFFSAICVFSDSILALEAPLPESSCGPAALHAVAKRRGLHLDRDFIASLFKDPHSDSISMLEMIQAAQRLGFNATGVRMSVQELYDEKHLVILLIDHHYVVVVSDVKQRKMLLLSEDQYVLLDARQLEETWTGEAIILQSVRSKTQDFAKARTDAPSILFDSLVCDMGEMSVGGSECTFDFINIGKDGLKIVSAETSCACTVADVSDKVYGSLEKGQIKAKFDFTADTGFVKQVITLHTNDPDNEVILLEIWAVVGSGMTYSPRALTFGEIISGMAAAQKVTLCFPGGRLIGVDAVTFSSASYSAEVLNPYVERRNGARVTLQDVIVMRKPSDRAGKFNDRATLKVSGLPDSMLPLTGAVTPSILANPPVMSFGNVKRGSESVKSIRIESVVHANLRLDATNVFPDDLRLKTALLEADGSYRLIARITPQKTGIVVLNIRVLTEDGADSISLPISAKVE